MTTRSNFRIGTKYKCSLGFCLAPIFKNEMNTGSIEEFDGISLIEWTEDNKIKSLKEYGCNLNNYNPYQHSDNPQFRDEKTNWF